MNIIFSSSLNKIVLKALLKKIDKTDFSKIFEIYLVLRPNDERQTEWPTERRTTERRSTDRSSEQSTERSTVFGCNRWKFNMYVCTYVWIFYKIFTIINDCLQLLTLYGHTFSTERSTEPTNEFTFHVEWTSAHTMLYQAHPYQHLSVHFY